MKVTKLFKDNFYCDSRYIVNEGGTRSGKTYQICVSLIAKAYSIPNLQISVLSCTLPHLKKGVFRDFSSILRSNNIWNENAMDKTNFIYTFSNKSYIEFFSIDNYEKLRGPSRDIAYFNEVNVKIPYHAWQEIDMRTRKQIYCDYNPSSRFHWIYDKVIPESSCTLIKSTYKDNPFLEDSQKLVIESYKDKDPNYYKVMALGERASLDSQIFNHWNIYKGKWPEDGIDIYGIDFGFNTPTAIIKCNFNKKTDTIIWDELLYKSNLSTDKMLEIIDSLNIKKSSYIFCDHNEPRLLEVFYSKGYNAQKANKNVKGRIDMIKSKKFFITAESTNLMKELQMYSWSQNVQGQILDEPIKINDHAIDAGGYATYNFLTL